MARSFIRQGNKTKATGRKCALSPFARKWLTIQGYGNISDKALDEHKYGIRFAYALCSKMVLLGLVRGNLILLLIATGIAFLGIVLPRHPFDYLYNFFVRYMLRKPSLPARTIQARFACALATIFLSVTVFLLDNHYLVAGYVLGSLVGLSAILVSTTDICIPSLIYNSIFRPKGL